MVESSNGKFIQLSVSIIAFWNVKQKCFVQFRYFKQISLFITNENMRVLLIETCFYDLTVNQEWNHQIIWGRKSQVQSMGFYYYVYIYSGIVSYCFSPSSSFSSSSLSAPRGDNVWRLNIARGSPIIPILKVLQIISKVEHVFQ